MSANVHVTALRNQATPPTAMDATKGQSQFSLGQFVRRTWVQLLIAFSIFSVGLAIALWLFFTLGQHESDNIKTIYARRAEALALTLQSQIDGFETELVSLGTQMQLQPNTTRAQFKAAFDRLNNKITGRCAGCWQGIAYAPIVLDVERAHFEFTAQTDMNDTTLVFKNTSSTLPNKNPTEPEYVPVYFIEPLDGNKGAILFNLASSASRNFTITRARTTSQTQATPPIELVQEGENSGTSSGILIMHPFDRSEALQPGKEEMQGIISGVVRLKTFVENFLKASGDHLIVSLIDVSESSELFSPPTFLHEIEADDTGILRSQADGLSAADVVQKALQSDLLYDGQVECFSRTWRLLIVGDDDDYVAKTSVRLNAIVFIIVFVATVLFCSLVLFTVLLNDQKLRLSRRMISKLEVDSQRMDAENTAMQLFLKMTSHDLRTPIQAIVNSTQLLARGLKLSNSGDANYLNELVSISRSSCMMLDLIINNTLDSAKIQSGGQFDLVLETTYDLEGIMDDLLVTVDASTAGKKSVQVVRNIRLGGLGPVRCDQRKLVRVILNLVSNAVKFTSVGEITIHMFYRSSGDGGKVDLHFAVSDSGRGMSPVEVINACKPYVRTSTAKGGGSGLGLHICKTFIEACGGALYIESTAGVGTVVSFTLPVELVVIKDGDSKKLASSGDKNGSTNAKQAVNKSMHQKSSRSRLRVVLVADESPINVRLIKILLEKVGHKVLIAHDGADAFSILTDPTSNVSLAFLDLELSKVSVLDVVRRLKAWESDQGERREPVQLIALVTDTNEVSKVMGMKESESFVASLYKPPTAAELAIAMRIVDGCECSGAQAGEQLSEAVLSMTHDSDISIIIHEGDGVDSDGIKPRVLLVDDNNVLLRLSVIMMRSFGYAVTSAVNGREALNLMKGEVDFDVVFMDVDMPVMRGDEAVKLFRDWEKRNRAIDVRVKIVMMSGNVDERDIRQAIDCGADDFITKPFAPEVLKRHVSQALLRTR
uniref:histidine kinase n=1 Tax=Mantoniella antarctica TaxID=81844 RepID=A0A7S0S6S5_9CHLO|mmetsp:Transcript_11644/g.28226  ORF Transcript_11644/g.28226 Transcript_11644/m.28226 type:complete len:997 (+) Transcript_11644:193-3183(+)|eukprot:CAMPEP_0181360962 /NCGR_PEP_ID=MMETSP1106-20121128/6998_1 /TAXON_ID=81844 /ORGANISM="Mantoniella antarctica, Strain SL-175" /LENGTH=996 /DNA_ID=CAMNT_0023474375 /DNA_START=149 /DNA_END=3139 /DNA_ORIENTATION=+